MRQVVASKEVGHQRRVVSVYNVGIHVLASGGPMRLVRVCQRCGSVWLGGTIKYINQWGSGSLGRPLWMTVGHHRSTEKTGNFEQVLEVLVSLRMRGVIGVVVCAVRDFLHSALDERE